MFELVRRFVRWIRGGAANEDVKEGVKFDGFSGPHPVSTHLKHCRKRKLSYFSMSGFYFNPQCESKWVYIHDVITYMYVVHACSRGVYSTWLQTGGLLNHAHYSSMVVRR